MFLARPKAGNLAMHDPWPGQLLAKPGLHQIKGGSRMGLRRRDIQFDAESPIGKRRTGWGSEDERAIALLYSHSRIAKLARRNWEESLQARRFTPNHFGSNCRQVLYLPPS
jgi:hypothetical protein